ncbi:hypothetical protein HYX13_00190 [Candidatus Woesearchaeota archaeon]|nr:hypothetical protein [Candidatus Woesearchaeota archaeon]
MKKLSQKIMQGKTVVILLAFALAVSFVNLGFTYYKINLFGETVNLLTGAPSFSFGETNITITSNTALSLGGGNGTAISFGNGFINASCNFCQLDSNGVIVSGYGNGSNLSAGGQSQCCTTFVAPTSGFLLENTGNTNLSVGYTCTGNCTFASYLGGARGRYIAGTGVEIKVTSNSVATQSGEEGGTDTSSSCVGGGTLFRDSKWNITNSTAYTTSSFGTPEAVYTALMSGHWLCGNSSSYPLDSNNAYDAAVLDINITILADAPANGIKSSFRLTFNGTSPG